MNVQKWSHLLLLIPLLLSAASLQPAHAAGPLTTNPASVVWCPATVTSPIPGEDGCTSAYAKFADLLTLSLTSGGPAKAGVIWLGRSYNSDSADDGHIVIDGNILSKMARYPLTIKGGWIPGTGKLDLADASTFQGGSLNIRNWNKKVTLKNIELTLVATSLGNGCVSALCVETAGGILLDRVYVHDNYATAGASLDNRRSVTSLPGSVVVTNSGFSNNDLSGLIIDTNGAVNLRNVAARNDDHGVMIQNTSDTVASPVTVTDGVFSGHTHDGLFISANGPVTLTNLFAQGNQGNGISVDNAQGAGDVILKGTITVLSNFYNGLLVYSKSNITAKHLIADGNGTGAYLENNMASAKTITITGSGEFTSNTYGLYASSQGNVSLNRVNGDSNFIGAGITVWTNGIATLTCSGAYGNYIGLYVRNANGNGAADKLTLHGFVSYGNSFKDEDLLLNTPVVRTACP